MNNKVYYGEYSLQYWLELILKKEIILPEYQRTFVWDKEDVKSLIESINNEYFIPSITIGSYNNKNLIIDGQQRLTSLLLAYIGKYPKIESFNFIDETKLANENDDISENEDDNHILGWTFNELLKLGQSREEILSKLSDDYENLFDNKKNNEISINNEFFENHYLGFSYLIPQNNPQKYFSSVFRNINENGTKLSSLETRKALYFLKEGIDDLFDPDCIKNIYIEKDKKQERIDFLRYLSITFQYGKDKDSNNILKKFARKEEKYYTFFIDDFINANIDSIFNPYDQKLKEIIQNKKFDERITTNLKRTIEKLGFKGKIFQSIIDCDIYLFGLVYFIVVKNKSLDNTKIQQLKEKLDNCIEQIKSDPESGYLHKKTPSALKYIRLRIQKSINIYEEFVI